LVSLALGQEKPWHSYCPRTTSHDKVQSTRNFSLPLLSDLAGFPPVIRLVQQQQEKNASLSLEQMIETALPNVCLALVAYLVLTHGVVLPLLRQTSESSSRTSVASPLGVVDTREQEVASSWNTDNSKSRSWVFVSTMKLFTMLYLTVNVGAKLETKGW
jgi:hypothetical protein